ncbi:RNA polymerase sigma factor [Adhaeribacter radiodurans]|uniref:Sigma-70 family RNA polymerase sigma factor n=1 Tax=Adhaeribacter radiodurans TaxID=2745197 RepID=A0A7L7LE48_9BACT|nr:sigma-70 family RNA polymerase sigma factor [Adhaeribacter radiodurans]QMU31132.1 sigma-70 family RNA polymerase sigma factor [Adhaeribacter radiodurans]
MNTIQLSDSELVSLYIAGNENAFELLVKRHKNKVFTTILLIVKDTYTAEDLLQDTFIKAIHTMKSGRYNEEGKFSSWICRIAHNLAIDYFRKEKRNPTIEMEDGSNVFNTLAFAEESIEALQIKEDTHKRLRELIQQLPEAQKEVLIMRHYADMSFQEIAETTGVSINTALGRMRYALINLRKKMTNQNIDYDKNLYTQ